ncbi:MAG: hypothetical protein ACYTDW_17455 [Planctomycetota bacterium]|jgi:hypothetical protein
MPFEQAIYPRGFIALGSGDLIDVTNVTVDTTDNSKQVHTIRQKGAGVTQGVEETTIAFDAALSEFGEEADWLQLVKKQEIKQLRVKVPGRTITVNGKFRMVKYELPLDDAIKVSVEFIGKLTD